MEDDYLKLFGNMFYNIKEDQDNKKIIEEASEVLASIIIKYGELINEITARTSAQDEFVDTVICLFLRKIMEQPDALNSYRFLSKRKTGDFTPRFSGSCVSVFNLKNIFYRHFQVMCQPDCNLKRGITFSTFDAAYQKNTQNV